MLSSSSVIPLEKRIFEAAANMQWKSSVTPSRGGAFDSAKNHKRQRRKRQSVTAKREKSQSSYRLG